MFRQLGSFKASVSFTRLDGIRCHPEGLRALSNLVLGGPEPWWGSSVAPGDSATDSNDSAVNGSTNGVVDLAVELWQSVSVDDGGLLKITKSRGVHNVTHNVSREKKNQRRKKAHKSVKESRRKEDDGLDKALLS